MNEELVRIAVALIISVPVAAFMIYVGNYIGWMAESKTGK